jgi:hypothetical protein
MLNGLARPPTSCQPLNVPDPRLQKRYREGSDLGYERLDPFNHIPRHRKGVLICLIS